MKIKITTTMIVKVRLEDYPDAKTIDDVVKIQQEWIDDGSSDPEEMMGEDYKVTVEAVKDD